MAQDGKSAKEFKNDYDGVPESLLDYASILLALRFHDELDRYEHSVLEYVYGHVFCQLGRDYTWNCRCRDCVEQLRVSAAYDEGIVYTPESDEN